MSDIAEGIGGAIEGALAGRAVEPKRGEGDQDTSPTSCLNCGAQVDSKFCAECGQKAHVHRTLSAILHDLMHGVLHLDGKLWRTLPMLMFKPGQLTRRYIDGERAKFVSPMAMFLFSVFAMFAVFQAIGISAPTDIRGDAPEQIREFAVTEIERLEQRQLDLTAQRDAANLSASERATLDAQIAEVEGQLQGIRQAQEELPIFNQLTSEQGADGNAQDEAAEGGFSVIPLGSDGQSQLEIGSSEIV